MLPQRLQGLIRLVYERATTQIALEGRKVVPVALFALGGAGRPGV